MRAFKRHFYRDIIFYSLCILSLGIVYLLSYWSNLLYCRLRFSQCRPQDGDYFLINGEINKTFLVSINNMHIPAFKHQLQRYILENGEFAVQKFHFTKYTPFQTIQEIHNAINRFGHNITLIPQKPLAIIIIREIISPLFIIQILSIGLWIYEGYVSYSCILFVISLYSIIETAVAYNSNRRLMSDLKQPESVATVIRLGEEIDIRSVDIVPGDTIIIKGNFIIPCDAIIIQGNCVVDEKNLTGESEPVYKNIKSMLYSSSVCIKSQECIAFVIATGFQTEKGKLIREILYTPEISIDFYKDSLSYLIWLSVAAILGYIIALPFKLKFQEKHPEVPQNDLIFDVLDLLTVCVPPTLPTSLQIGLSIVLNRLQSKGIYCTNVQKINTAGCTQIVCFDSAITQQNFILNGFCESHNSDIVQIEEVSDILLTCSIVCNTMIAEEIGQKAETILFQEAKASLIANIVTLKGRVYQIIKTQPTDNMVVVVAEYDGQNYVYAKADPEKVYHKWSIPQNHVRLIKQYLSNGFYVVACAYKQYQEPLQSNLHYLGLIIYANKPRDHTIQIIDQLNRSQIKTIIISSENIRSASSIAKVCGVSKQLTMGILTKNEFDKQEVKWSEFEQDNEEILKSSIILEQKSIQLDDEELDPINSNQDLSITGELFEYFVKQSVQNDNYQQLERILNLTKVYGGFKPQQKQILIQYMKRLQKQIAFCGDGGADILAFKTADIGISFAVNKYSVSAPFTSTQQNISCVPYILRQGRSALTISFYSFKYQTITSLIQFISCTLLYFQYAYMTNSQFLILDLFVTLPLSILMSYTDAAEELHKDIPPKSLKSKQVLFSVIGQTIIQLIFQGIVYFAQINQDWYVDSVVLSNGEYTNEGYLQSFETTSLFLVSNFQYLATSIALQINNKFNQSVLNNTPYCLYCVLILIFNLYLILFARQEDTMDDYFNLTFKVTQKDKHYEMPTSWIHLQYHKYNITFDGKIYHVSQPHEIQHSIIAEAKYKEKIELIEINRHLDGDCDLRFIQYQDLLAQKAFQLSCGLVVASVLKHFYKYEIQSISATNINSLIKLHEINNNMHAFHSKVELNKHLANQLQNVKQFERALIPTQEIYEMFEQSQYKLINANANKDFQTVYKYGDFFTILDGPLLPDTQLIKQIILNDIQKESGIFNAQGTINQDAYDAFLNTKYLHESDHKHIGRKQNLFFFNKYAPGSAFFLEKGTIIYNKLQNFLRNEYRKRGFKEVHSPQLFNKELWKISGHLDNYASNIYFIEEMGLKPMNCPGHCLIYESQLHNSKELPIRYAEFGTLHRNEVHGSLTGLTRLRKFCQDDAHIFCRPDQIEQEINSAIEFLDFVYRKLGFKYTLLLSTRPDEFIGTEQEWDQAEQQLVKALQGRDYKVNAKDGAFYGPKIDVMIKDARGKEHQCGTIQLDFNLPQRFNLQFQHQEQFIRPVMIHRAILGSIERMIGILTEEYQGRWPFWLSPRQVKVISVDANEYAETIRNKLHNDGFDVDLDISQRSVGKKIREAQEYHYNYIVVVGNKEKERNLLTVREMEKQLNYEEFLLFLNQQLKL